jgi:hypothetical protein
MQPCFYNSAYTLCLGLKWKPLFSFSRKAKISKNSVTFLEISRNFVSGKFSFSRNFFILLLIPALRLSKTEKCDIKCICFQQSFYYEPLLYEHLFHGKNKSMGIHELEEALFCFVRVWFKLWKKNANIFRVSTANSPILHQCILLQLSLVLKFKIYEVIGINILPKETFLI